MIYDQSHERGYRDKEDVFNTLVYQINRRYLLQEGKACEEP